MRQDRSKLAICSQSSGATTRLGRPNGWRRRLLWLSGVWVLPLCWILRWILPPSALATSLVLVVACSLAPLPALLLSRRHHNRVLSEARKAREEAEQLKLQLETVRYRTARLREELSAADRQARLSHQLTLLGQFTAGFLHEFNNPLAIVTNRIEVLLEERKDDAALCADLEQMLKETRYMGNIAAHTAARPAARTRARRSSKPRVPTEALRGCRWRRWSPRRSAGCPARAGTRRRAAREPARRTS